MVLPTTSFQEWNPHAHLAAYCAKVEQHTLRFLVREFRKDRGPSGGAGVWRGPNPASRAPLSPYVSQVSLVAPGGLFVMAALRNCSAYPAGGKYFGSANINEADVEAVFRETGFDLKSTTIEVAHVPEHEPYGYQSLVLASGFLRSDAAARSRRIGSAIARARV